MNVREEDRKKASCSGRGLGLATAAIGLGVGAALYYFLSKGSPQQETEASSSSSWGCEQPNVFRERPWTVEDCSICFDVMQRHQEIMTLSCAHNFHAQCIMPWLQEKQTCPNCRKLAE